MEKVLIFTSMGWDSNMGHTFRAFIKQKSKPSSIFSLYLVPLCNVTISGRKTLPHMIHAYGIDPKLPDKN